MYVINCWGYVYSKDFFRGEGGGVELIIGRIFESEICMGGLGVVSEGLNAQLYSGQFLAQHSAQTIFF